jgi:hypothetical protein
MSDRKVVNRDLSNLFGFYLSQGKVLLDLNKLWSPFNGDYASATCGIWIVPTIRSCGQTVRPCGDDWVADRYRLRYP